jgi:hypothetical protein
MTDFPSFPVSESAARIAELEAVIDRADQHTAMLMKSIDGLEERLKAAEYAARVNYDGWQQEIARSSSHAQSLQQWPPSRRDVARIIDPNCFWDDEPPNSHQERKCERALIKADAILALADTSIASHAQCQQERGWLIEWPEDETVPARWWNPATGWMRDANKAMRFARECDAADYVAANTFVTSVRPTEHVFGLSLSSTDCEGK